MAVAVKTWPAQQAAILLYLPPFCFSSKGAEEPLEKDYGAGAGGGGGGAEWGCGGWQNWETQEAEGVRHELR